MKRKSILESFENIVDEIQSSKDFNNEFFETVSSDIKYARRKLKLTEMQIVLLALFVDHSDNHCITLSDLAKDTGCSTTKMLRLMNDIEILNKKRYIRMSNNSNFISFRVPLEVIKCLQKNEPYIYKEEPVVDTYSFFYRLSIIIDDINSHDELKEKVTEMLDHIKDSVFAKTLRQYKLTEEENLLFIYMTHLFVNNEDDCINFFDLAKIYDGQMIPFNINHKLHNHTSELFTKELIENSNENGMVSNDVFKLTNKAKSELLQELNIADTVTVNNKNLIKPDTLAPKKLIYNSSEQKQIDELTSILSPERFNDIQSRLRDAGMRTGFCCIFYGSPGTGKTETVYQIARQTGREILRVDIDRIKSCWVGESEKNIKSLFDRYRNICKNSKLAPILLFNEADAVLGVRMEGASNAVDKMENSIQNIILQEMENLEGIMIATTNLTSNLDKAFERRFLYKIRFNKPSTEARAQIWQNMIKGLNNQEALTLASSFELSGGEIENIARKHSVNAILSGNDSIDLQKIIATCQQERLSQTNRPVVGF